MNHANQTVKVFGCVNEIKIFEIPARMPIIIDKRKNV